MSVYRYGMPAPAELPQHAKVYYDIVTCVMQQASFAMLQRPALAAHAQNQTEERQETQGLQHDHRSSDADGGRNAGHTHTHNTHINKLRVPCVLQLQLQPGRQAAADPSKHGAARQMLIWDHRKQELSLKSHLMPC